MYYFCVECFVCFSADRYRYIFVWHLTDRRIYYVFSSIDQFIIMLLTTLCYAVCDYVSRVPELLDSFVLLYFGLHPGVYRWEQRCSLSSSVVRV